MIRVDGGPVLRYATRMPSSQADADGRQLPSWLAPALLALAIFMLALHWVHLTADAPWKYFPGHFQSKDWSGDLYSDEGWEANAATRAAITGNWYLPGDFNLAVDAPFFPAMLYLPFKLFGVSMWLARLVVVACFTASAGLIYLLLRDMLSPTDTALVTALLATNFLALAFSRTALVEPVVAFFIVASLYAAKRAAVTGSRALALLAGIVLSLGVLTKLVAVSAALPLLAILWLLSGPQYKVSNCIAALCGTAPLPVLHRVVILTRFKRDHDFYTYINITRKSIGSIWHWPLSLARIGAGIHYVGPLLYVAFLSSAVLFLLHRPRQFDVLTKIGLVWLGSSIIVFSTITYFPPRYCLTILFPLVVLTVHFTASVWRKNHFAGLCLYGLIALALLFDSVQVMAYSLKPRYSFVHFTQIVASEVPVEKRRQCAIAGDVSNTVSLYTGILSANLIVGTDPAVERIERCDPSVYLTAAPATEDAQHDFAATGRSLTLDKTIDVLGNYSTGLPLYVYKVERSNSSLH